MSSGSMYGMGMAWKMVNSGCGVLARRLLALGGQVEADMLYIPSFCNKWVLQLVG